ncbi:MULTISPECIES: glycoside hydrolase family 1 protein [Cupriavidus]
MGFYSVNMKKIIALGVVFLQFWSTSGRAAVGACEFLWGTASSAYQVEGGWNSDGKGPSNWDQFTHQGLTKNIIGRSDNADVSVNQLSRAVYLDDIRLMKRLGVNAYRFSISWSRIMPDGQRINQKGIDYYRGLIADLKAAGITPVITLYHWDMPLSLYEKGGWGNPDSPEWFGKYSRVVFENFGRSTPYFLTFNEPEGDIFTLTPLVKYFLSKTPSPYEKALSVQSRAEQAQAMHHLLLANARAVKNYRDGKYGGKIGIALNLSPCVDPVAPNSQAATTCSLVHNGWILDALYKGAYPAAIEANYRKYAPLFKPSKKEMQAIMQGRPDFIGVNYYSPTLVKNDDSQPFGVGNVANPDKYPSYNGPVSPAHLLQLLRWLDRNYDHPEMIITENGAGFGASDEKAGKGVVLDPLRAKYLVGHADIVEKARAEKINLSGYLFWSFLDNFEWLFGYQNRFGLVSVDFNDPSLRRTPKSSYFAYKDYISSYRKRNSCK